MHKMIPPRIAIDYLPHQLEGVQWMLDQEAQGHGGILADDMGLGKTFQTIGLIKNSPADTLIVCPPALVQAWSSELRACGFRVWTMSGESWINVGEQINVNNIWLTTYNKVSLYSSHMGRAWTRIIFDEGHCLRNKNKSWFSCFTLAAEIKSRWILTATPIQNGRKDWMRLVEFLGTDVMLRRTMAELRHVIETLPTPAIIVEHALTLPERSLEARVFKSIQTIGEDPSKVLVRIIREQQFLVHPQIYFDSVSPVRWRGSSTKFTAFTQVLAQSNEPTIVFCQFRAEIEMVRAHIVSVGKRSVVIASSQDVPAEIGQGDVLIVQIVAGGCGLNLQACTRILFLSMHWNPAVVHQAIGRAVRIGQKSQVTVHFFRLAGTIDDRVEDLHLIKIEAAQVVCPSFYL